MRYQIRSSYAQKTIEIPLFYDDKKEACEKAKEISEQIKWRVDVYDTELNELEAVYGKVYTF